MSETTAKALIDANLQRQLDRYQSGEAMSDAEQLNLFVSGLSALLLNANDELKAAMDPAENVPKQIELFHFVHLSLTPLAHLNDLVRRMEQGKELPCKTEVDRISQAGACGLGYFSIRAKELEILLKMSDSDELLGLPKDRFLELIETVSAGLWTQQPEPLAWVKSRVYERPKNEKRLERRRAKILQQRQTKMTAAESERRVTLGGPISNHSDPLSGVIPSVDWERGKADLAIPKDQAALIEARAEAYGHVAEFLGWDPKRLDKTRQSLKEDEHWGSLLRERFAAYMNVQNKGL